MASYEHDAVADGAVVTWAGTVQVTAGPAGVRAAEIPQWSAARAETPSDLGAMTIFEGRRDDKSLRHLRQALTELDEFFAGNGAYSPLRSIRRGPISTARPGPR